MESAELFTSTLSLVGAVIIIAALLSGLIERSGLPQVAVFLALGALLGPVGLSLLNIQLDSEILRVVATLSLMLVLFTDAVSLDIKEVRQHVALALRVLGPGTMLSAILMAIAGKYLLELSWPSATMLGAALASTDPVMLRGFLRRREVPAAVRQALRLESGMNDAVLLPIIFIAMAFLNEQAVTGRDWGRMAINMFLLGPGAGIAVGLVSVAVMDLIRRQIGIRRDYESLYSLGVAFAAYSAAEALHGSGFLAAFSAGLVIAIVDVELCDCFLEYGETTAEMALLFTFVLFGTSLIWSGFNVLNVNTLLFIAAVFVARPIAFYFSLARSNINKGECMLIAWFGPRGLSSLLLILLPVFAGISGSEQLFSICCAVVLFSVVIHGGSLMLFARRSKSEPAQQPQVVSAIPMEKKPDATVLNQPAPAPESNITIDQMLKLQEENQNVYVLDVRSDRSYQTSDLHAKGAIRVHPDDAVRRVRELDLDKNAWLIAFCA
jgi:NhaP-type Na+/H+ or K+/H+ antiporter